MQFIDASEVSAFMKYIYMYMSPTLSASYKCSLQSVKISDTLETHVKIIFDSYSGLPLIRVSVDSM